MQRAVGEVMHDMLDDGELKLLQSLIFIGEE
jgi:hypothetical protein